MGSQLKSEYSPIMLQVQIGNVICQARFIVTNHLKSSKILLGSDFLVKNHMSIGAINPEDHSWICTIGTPIIGKVKGKVINKISLTFGDNVYMAPNEVKRIEVQDVPEDLVLKSTWHGHPSIIVTPQEKNMVEIHNNSLLPATIFPNLPIVEALSLIHI